MLDPFKRTGWSEPGGFALMRDFLQGSGWTVHGVDIDTTADRVWSRATGHADELGRNYTDLQEVMGAPNRLALPLRYLRRAKATPKFAGAWDGPQAAEVAGPGWSANNPGTPRNPNVPSHGQVWGPEDAPRFLGMLPGDAPDILGVDRATGTMFSLLQVWHALRDGATLELFELVDNVTRRHGHPLDLRNVFVVCVPGARIGFGLTPEASRFMKREEEYAHWAGPLDPIFRRNITRVGDRHVPVDYTVDDRPEDLDLGKLAQELVLAVEVNGTKIPDNQVIFDPRCSLSWRNDRGEMTRRSKRLIDAAQGKGAFTGEKPAERRATCFTGMVISRA